MSLEIAKLAKKVIDALIGYKNDVRIIYWVATDRYHIELVFRGQTRYLEDEEMVLYLIKEIVD